MPGTVLTRTYKGERLEVRVLANTSEVGVGTRRCHTGAERRLQEGAEDMANQAPG